ncbi:MAG TPA: palindromic element RPE4 domain-containing protein [Rickettsia endosymbiont of Omalisus fontisbellaquei]|nr:palindromic element RPE4 domain-containing protein [Rickettsia endosymbiont of Omalisus fontisbellaquei]
MLATLGFLLDTVVKPRYDTILKHYLTLLRFLII